MSLLNSLAKLYVKLVFREEKYDSLGTQRKFNVPEPPRKLASRCQRVDGNVKAFWIDRSNASSGVLVYLHGGAFYFGPVKEHWYYLGRICRKIGMAGIMVDYGLAPQRPFPMALNEAVGLVSTLSLPSNWAVLGDSSGAGLACSVCFELRKAGSNLPSRLVLMSPWVDATLTNPDIELTRKDDVMMTVERLSAAAQDYVGDHDATDPLISPIYGDLAGLPPMLIQTGTADLLLADCRELVSRCKACGVDVEYEEYPDAFHDFMMLSMLPEARRALKSQARFLRE